jgi:trypsin
MSIPGGGGHIAAGRAPATMCLAIGFAACGVDRSSDADGDWRASAELRPDGGRIAGSVWDDADGDGRFDRYEEGLRSVRVYLDDNDNGVLDDGERATASNARGRYSIGGLPAGTYNVRQEVPFGLRNTTGGEGPEVTPIAVERSPGSSIIGGAVTTIEEYPFMVAVGVLFEGQFIQICGGSLITDRWVVTAAHCTEGILPGGATVLVGTSDVTDGSGKLIEVAATFIHPDYLLTPEDPTDEPFSVLAGFDIALWELATPVALAESDLNTVEMLHAGTRLDRTGTLATTIGWGVTDLDTRLLQQVHVPIFDQDACHEVYVDSINFETQICAGVPEGGISSCFGDSGGPLLVRSHDGVEWRLSGITSYAYGCAEPGHPSVWARVSALSDWVEATAREPSRVHRVEVRPGSSETADFGDRTTLRPERERIEPRWQLTNLGTRREGEDGLALSWTIIDEARRPRPYECSFDLDGPGPRAIEQLPCAEGPNHAEIAGAPVGLYLSDLVAVRADANESFRRDPIVVVGTPPVSSAEGALTGDDPIDPDFPDEPSFIDYFDLAGLSGQKAVLIRVTSTELVLFVSLYDRDLREAGDPASVIDRFERTFQLDGSITAELAFFPDPTIRHVIGVSTSIGAQTGSYSVEVVNEGDPVATTLDIPPAPIDVRR